MSGLPITDAGCWLATRRLALRRFTDGDFDWFAALYGDADVTRHLGGVKSRSDARALFGRADPSLLRGASRPRDMDHPSAVRRAADWFSSPQPYPRRIDPAGWIY